MVNRHIKICSTLLSIAVVQLLSHLWLFATSWTIAHQVSLSFLISWNFLKLMSIESVMPSNHLFLYHPFLLFSASSNSRVFPIELTFCIRWPNYWSFSFKISPSNEYSGLISFKIDWFDLPAVKETLKSFLQHHNLKASILRHSVFYMVQLSYPHMASGERISLTRGILSVK